MNHAQFRKLLEREANAYAGASEVLHGRKKLASEILEAFNQLPDVAAEIEKVIKDLEKSNKTITFNDYKESEYPAGKRDTLNYVLSKLKELSK